MKVFTMSKSVERIIVKKTGYSIERLKNLSLAEERDLVNEKMGRDLAFSNSRNRRKVGRGNPLLARKRIRTMDDVNNKIDSIVE